jgi:AraC family transcriptional regulator
MNAPDWQASYQPGLPEYLNRHEGCRMPLGNQLAIEFREEDSAPAARQMFEAKGFSVEHFKITKNAPYDFHWVGGTHYLALHDILLDDGENLVDGITPRRPLDLRNTMTFVPNGCSVRGWAAPAERKNSCLMMHIDPELISRETELKCATTELAPMVYFDNPGLRAKMEQLQQAILDLQGMSMTLMETLGLQVAVELWNQHACVPDRAGGHRGALSRRQEKFVADYIEGNIGSDLSLEALAGLTGLSRFHFARAFKATTGLPPHQYVLKARMETAKRLLAESALPVPEIGAGVGFKTATQFSRAFGRFAGVSPGTFRRTL